MVLAPVMNTTYIWSVLYEQETPHMPRTFAYCRVSTVDQTNDNQVQEIQNAGFHIEPHRIAMEKVSGSSAIEQRPAFIKLLDKLERDDVLVVTKMDRLGRNSIDVQTTVAKLEAAGVRVHCLALGGVDLTSSAGKMTMGVIAAVAQFERDLIIERTKAGLERARKEGKVSGRRNLLTSTQQASARARLAAGETVSALARELKTSRMTVMRVREA